MAAGGVLLITEVVMSWLLADSDRLVRVFVLGRSLYRSLSLFQLSADAP
jgi:hypothetical protein